MTTDQILMAIPNAIIFGFALISIFLTLAIWREMSQQERERIRIKRYLDKKAAHKQRYGKV